MHRHYAGLSVPDWEVGVSLGERVDFMFLASLYCLFVLCCDSLLARIFAFYMCASLSVGETCAIIITKINLCRISDLRWRQLC